MLSKVLLTLTINKVWFTIISHQVPTQSSARAILPLHIYSLGAPDSCCPLRIALDLPYEGFWCSQKS
jgi:hypothetical protein